MTRHRQHQRSLNAYVDGELRPSESRRLEEHLAECGECRFELEKLKELQRLLRQGLEDPAPQVTPVLWPGVRARIESGRPPSRFTAWIRQIWEATWERPRLSLSGGVVIAFLILWTGYLLLQAPVGTPPGKTIVLEPGQAEVVVEAVEPEPEFGAMVLTTSHEDEGLQVIWVVARGEM